DRPQRVLHRAVVGRHVRRVGLIDMRAQAGVLRARRTDTPTRVFANGMAGRAPTFEATLRTQRAWPGVRRAMPPPGKKAARSKLADRDWESRKGCQAR